MDFTSEQIETYREDGFLVVEDYLSAEEVEALRCAHDRVYAGEFPSVTEPESAYSARKAPDTVTRELVNIWKSDPAFAAVTFKEEAGRHAAQLLGSDSTRLLVDSALLKPVGGSSFAVHQDAPYHGDLDPVQMVTLWTTLDEANADTGTIIYVRGSHKWGKFQSLENLYQADDWFEEFKQNAPDDVEFDVVTLDVKPGAAVFHSGWVWHGSPAMNVAGRQRRSYIRVLAPGAARYNPAIRNPFMSRCIPFGSTEFPDAFFPILWSSDGSRSDWLDDYVEAVTKSPPLSSYSPEASRASRVMQLSY